MEKIARKANLLKYSVRASRCFQQPLITTFVNRCGQCHLLFAHLKLMTRPEIFADNIADGRTGNLLNTICLETGIITKSLVQRADGAGHRLVSHHPVTQRELTGFPIPHWREVCDLVRRAARVFLPVRSVGWDVAVTDEGVKIVEGNIWWDRRDYARDYLATLLNDLDPAWISTA